MLSQSPVTIARINWRVGTERGRIATAKLARPDVTGDASGTAAPIVCRRCRWIAYTDWLIGSCYYNGLRREACAGHLFFPLSFTVRHEQKDNGKGSAPNRQREFYTVRRRETVNVRECAIHNLIGSQFKRNRSNEIK